MITLKDEKLMADPKVREYLEMVNKKMLESLDVYQAINRISEAVSLGIPYSYEFNKETRMIDVVLHRDMVL
jgi:hypothetical protein